MEVMEAEGGPLEDFNVIIAAFSEAVGQANVECVEYAGSPVDEHLSAFVELRRLQPVAGV